MDKTKIIAGVGILAAGLGLVLLLRRPAQPPENGGNGNGNGAECLVDSDCPDYYVCVDGQCIPR
jgi:hypothetical protein